MPTNVTAVTTTVTALCTVSVTDPITIKNQGPATVFLDIQNGSTPSPVTADQATTGGYPLAPDEVWAQPAYNASGTVYTVYGITAEGTAYVSAIGS